MARFRTRARTIDMLGRQQIAGTSTAISELFKNAYDAYADHVEVDYFRSDNLLVIRDDGIGMTKEEFEERWLVIGTESKVSGQGKQLTPYRPKNKHIRAIMGEKGIGRLAIALLGRQVFVLTRAMRDDKLHDLVMCFIHWGFFEIPELNLDEITIPIQTCRDTLPDSDDISVLVDDWRDLTKKLRSKFKKHNFDSILKDLDDFQLDPSNLDQFLGGISIKEKPGTHFYIAPANDSIASEIESDRQAHKKDFSKFLLGFCNTTFASKGAPAIKTAFRYRPSDSNVEDLIGGGEFFTPEELSAADHQITGEFDEFGQFKGTVRVYEKKYEDHVISWKDSDGKPTACGPFSIEFGYLHGEQRNSQVPPEEWARLGSKLDSIGGLYVYRDQIRILPYGNSDVDWLDIELRRNKGAGHYFFSYRRIFGAVAITRAANGRLHEKAGREGFQQDKAYRQFKSILENLFLQLAADFFREGGDRYDFFQARKLELEKTELARRKREKQATTKRKGLATALDAFFQKVGQGLAVVEINELRGVVTRRMEAAAKMTNRDEASTALLDAEKEANRRLTEVRDSYRVPRPRGVGLSRTLQRDWEAYGAEQERLETEVFSPFLAEVTNTLGTVASQARVYIDQRKRLEQLISQVAEGKRKEVRTEAGKLGQTATETQRAALRTARTAIEELQKTIASVEADFAREDITELKPDRIEDLRRKFEIRIEDVGRKNTEVLGKVRDMLAAIAENLAEGVDVSQLEMVEAMDEELQSLRDQVDTDTELVQLGLAVAVINHEFEAAIKGIRSTLRELHSWARANKSMVPLYQEIRNNFDHLDGHLNLFTPLQRRLYRTPIPIKGSDIYHYTKALFDVRLKRHSVEIKATESFLQSEIATYPSTLYPVYVNIVDNALFWLKDARTSREIVFDCDGKSYLISNSGPAIHRRDYESAFAQGFSRKPGGRGLGLFVSRKALRKEGMDIAVVPSEEPIGVTFRILWPHAKKGAEHGK